MSDQVAIVDGADPQSFYDTLAHHELSMDQVTMVLTTHKHWDHAYGNQFYRESMPQAHIYGGTNEGVDSTTDTLDD